MRILYKPDKFLAHCNNCDSTFDLTDELYLYEPFHYIDDVVQINKNPFYDSSKIQCPVCKNSFIFWTKQNSPNLELSSGTCSYCGTDVAPGDTHCNKCGAPLKKG